MPRPRKQNLNVLYTTTSHHRATRQGRLRTEEEEKENKGESIPQGDNPEGKKERAVPLWPMVQKKSVNFSSASTQLWTHKAGVVVVSSSSCVVVAGVVV
ncbi:hypothetical protein CRE_29560 [Caenorhabditis remanei]|uniref:Uncharacterized protein n=1 Tax=Caenorhabditis remanei TaxID=31234 RepID=E3LVN8_CAERE|nr:hypothetical protein CRE_29560 [Caenorhabditis remanei]